VTQILDRDLDSLESLWDAGLGHAYDAYLTLGTEHRVALAAALVETALDLQALGRQAPPPGPLLLGDLCLARASRLLADVGDRRLQVGFAQSIEQVATHAAAGDELPSARDLLSRVIAR
jgi:hypothetical protein